MPRLVHKVTDRLSAEAQRLMLAGFRAKKTYGAITRDLAEIGEPVSDSTVARRAVEWRGEQLRRQAAREYAEDRVRAMKTNDCTLDEMCTALMSDSLLANAELLREADPLKVHPQLIRAREVAVKEREAGIRQRALELNERKFAVMEQRELRVKAALDQPAETMTPQQRIEEIRAIYGIRREANV